MQKIDIKSKNVTNTVEATTGRPSSNGITLVALVITIIVMLLLIGVTVSTVLKGDLFNIAKKASVETRASMVEEKVAEWKANKKIDEYLEKNSNTQSLDELLNDLETQQLITNEERKEIEENMEVKIGDKEILFYELPEGYVELEYLESTGTQYLNLGYYPNNNTKVETNVNILSYNVGVLNYLFGVYDSTRSYAIYYSNNSNGWGVLCGSVDRDTRVVYQKNMKQKVEFDRNNLSINGTSIYTVGSTTTFTSTKTMYLFWGNGTSKLQSISRVYDFKIYENDNIIMNLIPALDSNGTPCMYDTVTGQTFYNQGTGEFIAGYKN